MPRLSLPIADIQPYYDVVVVGSGYGGGIAASRFARVQTHDCERLTVCVLERGREFQPGDFPDTLTRAWAETQVDTPAHHFHSPTGLYDFRVNDDINVLVGCGLGGTSLINANVALQPEDRVFQDECWPVDFQNDIGDELKKGFGRAKQMLAPAEYPDDGPALRKLDALHRSALPLKRHGGSGFSRPLLTVSFKGGPNRTGVEQQACRLCGDCVSGCNYGAKSTVATTYLPDARRHGAKLFTEVAVRWLERRDQRWIVHYELLGAGRESLGSQGMTVSADLVVLAAGTLGSTEILLRSEDHGLKLSGRLGSHFSGNGDVLGLAYNTTERVHGVGFGRRPTTGDPVGPCITGAIDLRDQRRLDDGMVIEEGSIPGALAGLLPGVLGGVALLFGGESGARMSHSFRDEMGRLWRYLRGPYRGAVEGTQIFLVMGHDGAEGRLRLRDDRLRIDWPGVRELPVFAEAHARLDVAARSLGGTYLRNPFNPISVHPLGGCPMGEDIEHGVVDHQGQVFAEDREGYPGLYVCDASVIPRSLGVNPLFTISAIAERMCALLAVSRGWTITY